MEDDTPTQRVPADDLPTRPSSSPVVFKRYALVSEIGRGGMGAVWLARDRHLDNSEVALKFLKSELASDPQALQDLKREVLNNRILTHQNIIKVFSFESDEMATELSMRHAISMEFVRGKSLSALKMVKPENRAFEATEIRDWVLQLCSAMHHAHSFRDSKGQRRPVIHRDIKPANLLVNSHGEIKVCDFGIGCTVAETMSRLTNQATTSGTLLYMSPEQVAGRLPTPAQDIYSIGATIFELLTGQPPFFRGTTDVLINQIKNEPPLTLAERRKELRVEGDPIPEIWEKVVAACLAKDPALRPTTAFAIRDMLEGRPLEVAKPAEEKPSAKSAHPRWGRRVFATVAALAAASAGTWAYLKYAQPSLPLQDQKAPPVKVIQEPSFPIPTPPAPKNVPRSETDGESGVADLLNAGAITLAESKSLLSALKGEKGANEQHLAKQAAADHSISIPEWRDFSNLPPPRDAAIGKLRPLLASNAIRENEFVWLHGALTGEKGDVEQMFAEQAVDKKSLSLGEWRRQSKLFPVAQRDPLMEQIRPFLQSRDISPEEAQWIRQALTGKEGALEKARASKLIVDKTITPGQWRAQTTYSFALNEDAAPREDQLPPAIDIPLNETVKLRVLLVHPGSFVMGSPRDELGRRPNELMPERTIIKDAFYLGAFEVTQAQYLAVMPRSPSYWRGHPDWPIDQVDWRSVEGPNGFITLLNRRLATKFGGVLVADLPTEAEWEYACRAGTQTSFNNGSQITDIERDGQLDRLANYNRAAGGSPMAVGSFAPNAWGLYDMHGNVSEWCRDRYLRGGSWQSNAANCRATWRTQMSSDSPTSNQIGFRLVLRYKKSTIADH